MSRGMDALFGALLRREKSKAFEATDLRAVPPGRFQVLPVDGEVVIKQFVLDNGLTFKTGRGFYEFTKTETIQGHKEIILMDRKTGSIGTTVVAAFGLSGGVAAGLVGGAVGDLGIGWRTAYYIGGVMGLALLVLRVGVIESGMFRNVMANQSLSRGNSPGRAGSLPAMKSRKLCPAASIYFPSR